MHQFRVKSAESDLEAATQRVKSMLAEHAWIKDDRQTFGKPNTQYDFKVGAVKVSKKERRKPFLSCF